VNNSAVLFDNRYRLTDIKRLKNKLVTPVESLFQLGNKLNANIDGSVNSGFIVEKFTDTL
jgi:hypothetical protein